MSFVLFIEQKVKYNLKIIFYKKKILKEVKQYIITKGTLSIRSLSCCYLQSASQNFIILLKQNASNDS